MKKRSLAAALALALTLTPILVPTQVHANKTTYLDVNDELWYAVPVAFCQQHLLMDGLDGARFEPEAPLTRAVLAEALYRLEGSPEAPTGEPEESDFEEKTEEESLFSDVGEDHPNRDAIRWAKENGVVSGYEDGTFGPNDPVTREQIAVLLWNNRDRQEGNEAPFTDRDTVSDWARAAVDWAYEAKMMSGNPDGTFLPQDNTTRGQGAAIVMNYAKAFYGLAYGYSLPAPKPILSNTYNSDLFRLDEETGYLSYLSGVSVRGVDVSAHQKEIDWARVAASGMRFAMIRAGYRGYTLGTITKDEYFDANMSGALANGMDVGVYFFSQALTPAEAEEEAYQLLEWMEGYNVTYPVVFDWEEQDKEDSRTRNTDGNTVTACALAFCKVIEDAGFIPMTYGSPSKIYEGGLALEYLQDYPAFWLAHYTKETAPTSFRYHYDIWQYSSTGRVDGIEGNVDLNIALTNYSSRLPDDWWKYPV